MAKHKYREGDLVSYIETFYNNLHKMHRCVILEKVVLRTTLPTERIVKYNILTSEGEYREVWEEDILPFEENE